MKEKSHPPHASSLLGSLRAIGYSFDAALADIVDNSLSARATVVEISFRVAPELYVSIGDDGTGMSPATLDLAMQHGGAGPNTVRAAEDLGRFGLGLKTASLSQCRRLTVVTLHDGVMSGAEWNLDRVEATNEWTLGVLEEGDFAGVPQIDKLRAHGHGTVVVWREFDRALAGEGDQADALETLVDASRSHLGLVFHRFLKPESGRAVGMSINNVRIEPIDPFLEQVSTRLPSQSIKVGGSSIEFTAFILPHRSRLSKLQIDALEGQDGLRRTQGFYIYRGRRLIVYGSWFKLMRQDELTKLARVRVDVPNTLDRLWQLDVKKSTAAPPLEVRAGLVQVLDQIGINSKRVITHRGWKRIETITRLWERLETPTGASYQVNRHHPVVEEALGGQGSPTTVERLLVALEMTIPFQEIYVDVAHERDVMPRFANDEVEEELREMLGAYLLAAREFGNEPAARKAVPELEPFNRYPDTTARLLREADGA